MPNQQDNNNELQQPKKDTKNSIVSSIANILGISNSGDVAALAYNITHVVFAKLAVKYGGDTAR